MTAAAGRCVRYKHERKRVAAETFSLNKNTDFQFIPGESFQVFPAADTKKRIMNLSRSESKQLNRTGEFDQR